jgi:hypothetical protein
METPSAATPKMELFVWLLREYLQKLRTDAFKEYHLLGCDAVLKSYIFWDIMLCSPSKVNQHCRQHTQFTSKKREFFSHGCENLKSYMMPCCLVKVYMVSHLRR